MARYAKPAELEVAEATVEQLAAALGQSGPLRGIKSLDFVAGPDHTGDPSITFDVEFAEGEADPTLDRINEIEDHIKETARAHETDEYLFIYFRYRREGDEPPQGYSASLPPAQMA